MIHRLRDRWRRDGGYRDFLVVAVPLILSTASWSVQHFVDRVFLTWYSTDALAAALPAGMTSFVFVALFLGIASYVNTFVAQYVGAGRLLRVGPSLWQGAYLAVLSGGVGLGLAAAADPLFEFVGHEPEIRVREATYFRILCCGMAPLTLATAFSCFYSGRGKTWPLLAVNAGTTLVNISLDYVFIFGKLGLPAMGIRGAAWATILAQTFAAVAFVVLVARQPYRRRYATLSGWRFDPGLFRRLLRFGGPNGVTFMLDILAFTVFVLIIGRLGTLELTATNLAFNINSLAFMPLIGCGIAVSTMVGQRLGRDEADAAEYAAWSGIHLGLAYAVVMLLGYALVPDWFLEPYAVGSDSPAFLAARDIAILLLRFLAIYMLFDAMYMLFTAALKGAGDTRYVMLVSIALSWALMVAPAFVALTFFDADVYVLWSFLCIFIVVSGVVFYVRFRGGKWKLMRVIEEDPIVDEEETAPPPTGTRGGRPAAGEEGA